jgi:hypothetical protein
MQTGFSMMFTATAFDGWTEVSSSPEQRGCLLHPINQANKLGFALFRQPSAATISLKPIAVS